MKTYFGFQKYPNLAKYLRFPMVKQILNWCFCLTSTRLHPEDYNTFVNQVSTDNVQSKMLSNIMAKASHNIPITRHLLDSVRNDHTNIQAEEIRRKLEGKAYKRNSREVEKRKKAMDMQIEQENLTRN